MITIELDIAEAMQLCEEVRRRAERLEPAFQKSGIYMESSIAKNFSAQGRPRWKPLSPYTLAQRKGSGGRILQDTGRLRASVTSGAVKAITRTQLTYGTNIVYAAAHNFGYKQIPKREFLAFHPEDEARIKEIFEQHILNG